jgi:low temperature requirement protein LtrA
MARKSHAADAVTGDAHRVTSFEVFFDLVFVFAFTRIISFVVHDLTPIALLQGLILLVLMWWAWSAFTWLGNQIRADMGVGLVAGIVAMAAIFVVGLVIPEAWHDGSDGLDAPLALALAYTIVRLLYLSTFLYAAAGDRRLRTALVVTTIPTIVAWVPFIAGAVVGGRTQVVLWAAAFIIDFGGGAALSSRGEWSVRSPGYFAERHGLVVIIALGESLASVGAGIGAVPISLAILGASLLGLGLAVCLWLLYFKSVAPIAERLLADLEGRPRAQLARDAYTFHHFLLIAGVIYLAVGIEEVLAHVSSPDAHERTAPLGWLSTACLIGGAVSYLAGLVAVRWRTQRSTAAAEAVAIACCLLLVPVARVVPAVTALGLITTLLAVLAVYEVANRWQG